MGRWAGSGKSTCESCKSIDVRRWHRLGYLSGPHQFSWAWTCNGEPSGNISVHTETGQAVLSYRIRSHGAEWKPVEQRVPIVWTLCRYGGRRPWFLCAVYANGRYCGRRVAKLYGAGDLFACRHCYRLAYASQQESPQSRGISQAQKIRMRLGGSGSLDEPFPPKPKGMHWKTYHSLEERSYAAEEYADAMMAQWLLRRYGTRGI